MTCLPRLQICFDASFPMSHQSVSSLIWPSLRTAWSFRFFKAQGIAGWGIATAGLWSFQWTHIALFSCLQKQFPGLRSLRAHEMYITDHNLYNCLHDPEEAYCGQWDRSTRTKWQSGLCFFWLICVFFPTLSKRVFICLQCHSGVKMLWACTPCSYSQHNLVS